MLNRRTHILFDEDLWTKLASFAKKQNTSVGEFIRGAIREKISQEEILMQRKKAVENIKKIRPLKSKTPIDYKAWINHGRKY